VFLINELTGQRLPMIVSDDGDNFILDCRLGFVDGNHIDRQLAADHCLSMQSKLSLTTEQILSIADVSHFVA
jgi:hypothetical protein